MDLSDSEDEQKSAPPPPPPPPHPAAAPPPPPPPPPLPSAGPTPVSEDGVGQMTMMAKSRMHEELIKKAKLKEKLVDRQATPPRPPPTPPGPCPPPPPPPPPPPALAVNSKLTPNLEDCVTHQTAMSKSKMHQELISKAQTKTGIIPPSPSPAVAAPAPATAGEQQAREARERKRIVQEILDKKEPVSQTRKINEQRRREFFASPESPESDRTSTPTTNRPSHT